MFKDFIIEITLKKEESEGAEKRRNVRSLDLGTTPAESDATNMAVWAITHLEPEGLCVYSVSTVKMPPTCYSTSR